jgi:transposase
VRQRESLLQQRAREIQHMQKALHLMNVKLTTVITDLTGLTAMQIIRAILAGERDPVVLARFRDPRCKSSEAEIAKALTGNYQPEHLFALRQALEGFDFYTQQLAACDAEIESHYAVFQPQVDLLEQPLPDEKRHHRPHHPHYDLRSHLYSTTGVDLTAVTGIDVLLAQDILAEIGTDMSKWQTEKHFASWLGLAPNNKSSAGKVFSRHTRSNSNRAATAFRLAAQSASRSQSALGAFYRRIKAKQGAPVAITATAHKIARIVYQMLKHHTPYTDPGVDAYLDQQRQRALRSLHRLAHKLGFQVVPDSLPAVS